MNKEITIAEKILKSSKLFKKLLNRIVISTRLSFAGYLVFCSRQSCIGISTVSAVSSVKTITPRKCPYFRNSESIRKRKLFSVKNARVDCS